MRAGRLEREQPRLGEHRRAGIGGSFIFRALSHRNYKLFFAGQSISLIGTWMTRIATSWLVYRLTGSGWERVTGFVDFDGFNFNGPWLYGIRTNGAGVLII